MPKKPKIVIIIGPTASGKTSLAVFLAKALSGEVISADSRQVYRHLDLGTAKITEPEKEGIPHHLIDVALPSEVYSITDWISATKGAIEEIVTRDGTDNSCVTDRIALLLHQLDAGSVELHFEPDTESCNILPR